MAASQARARLDTGPGSPPQSPSHRRVSGEELEPASPSVILPEPPEDGSEASSFAEDVDLDDLVQDEGQADGSGRVERCKNLVSRQEVVLKAIQEKALEGEEGSACQQDNPEGFPTIRRNNSTSILEDMVVLQAEKQAGFEARKQDIFKEVAASNKAKMFFLKDAEVRRTKQKKAQQEEQQRKFFAAQSKTKECLKSRREMELERTRAVEAWYARRDAGRAGQRPFAPPSVWGRSAEAPGPMPHLFASMPALHSGGGSPRSRANSPQGPPSAREGGDGPDVYESALRSRAFYTSTMERWERVVAQNDRRCAAYWQKFSGERKSSQEAKRRTVVAVVAGKRFAGNGGVGSSPESDTSAVGSRKTNRNREERASAGRGGDAEALDITMLPSTRLDLSESEFPPESFPPSPSRMTSSPSRSSQWEARHSRCLLSKLETQRQVLLKWDCKREALDEARRRLDRENERRAEKAAQHNQQWREKSAAVRRAMEYHSSSDFSRTLPMQDSMWSTSSSHRATTADADAIRWQRNSDHIQTNLLRAKKLQEEFRERAQNKLDAKMNKAEQVQDMIAESRRAATYTILHEERAAACSLRISESDKELRQRAQRSVDARNERLRGLHEKAGMSFLQKQRAVRQSNPHRVDRLGLEQLQDVSSWLVVDPGALPHQEHEWSLPMLQPLALPKKASFASSEGAASQAGDQAFLLEIEGRLEQWTKELDAPRNALRSRGGLA